MLLRYQVTLLQRGYTMDKDYTVAELAQLVAKAHELREQSYDATTLRYAKLVYDAATEAGCADEHPLRNLVVFSLCSGECADYLQMYLDRHT